VVGTPLGVRCFGMVYTFRFLAERRDFKLSTSINISLLGVKKSLAQKNKSMFIASEQSRSHSRFKIALFISFKRN
jgi:hypothetical protein